MFWKNSAWSWDDAAGHDDDDGGYLLAADLRRTPDSAPDSDLNRISSTITTNLNHITTSGLKDPTDLDPSNSNYVSTLFVNSNQRQVTRDGDTARRLTVSHMTHTRTVSLNRREGGRGFDFGLIGLHLGLDLEPDLDHLF